MSGYRLNVDVRGLDELERAFRKSPQATHRALMGALRSTAPRVAGSAKRHAPKRYGGLAASIHVEGPTGHGLEVEAKVGTNLKYARYMEEGTGIYGPRKQMIRPKRAKVLSWVSGGRRIFARQVKGSKPHWYFKKAHNEAKEIFPQKVKGALDAVIKELIT